jgi:hypothetical protein
VDEHPRIELPPGTIRRLMDRTRHLREPRTVATAPPTALPGDEVVEWNVERGRQELDGLLARARRSR